MRVAIVVLCLAALLAACADSGDPQPFLVRTEAATPAGFATGQPPFDRTGSRSLYEERVDVIGLISPYYQGDSPQGVGETNLDWWIAHVDNDLSSDRQLKVRRTVTEAMIRASTANCDEYLNSLRGDQVGARTFSDVLATGFGVAGSLAGGPQWPKLLSGLAGASTAVGASIDRNVFAQQAVELIAEQIRKYRATARSSIEAELQQQPYSAYPLTAAMADVTDFHADCSLMKGLVLTQDSLTKREALVEAARQAAWTASRGGTSGATVSDIVAAIVQAGSDQPTTQPAAANTISSLTMLPSAPMTDLDQMKSALSSCLDDALKAMQGAAATKVATVLAGAEFTGPKCGAGGWDGQFTALIGPALNKSQLDTIQGQAAADSVRQANIAAEFTKIDGAVEQQAAGAIEGVSVTRSAAQAYVLALGKSGATATQVVSALNAIAGAPPAAGDPFIQAMIAGATVVQSDVALQPNGAFASQMAVSGAQAFETNFAAAN